MEHDGSEDSEYNPEEEKRDYDMDDTQASNEWNQTTRTSGGFDPDAVQTAGTQRKGERERDQWTRMLIRALI